MKAFFFDRDGIVNRKLEGDYVKRPDEMIMLEGFLELLPLVKRAGFIAILITNQQGVGKGLMTERDLEKVHAHMQKELLERVGTCFDSIFFCPDLANAGSSRRKPAPGMILEAIELFGLAPQECLMLGDSRSDAQAAQAAGVKSWLLNATHTSETAPEASEIFRTYDEVISKFVEVYDAANENAEHFR